MRDWINAGLEVAALAAWAVLDLFAPVTGGQTVTRPDRGRQAMGQPVLD